MLDDDFFERSDLFINVANKMAADCLPEEVGEAMMYATARYTAFLIVNATAGGRGNRNEFVERMLEEMRKWILHNLANMALPETDSPPVSAPTGSPRKADINNPNEVAMAEAYDLIGRAMAALDIVLVAYLRGKGEQEAADSVTVPAMTEKGDFKQYLSSVYGLWEAGLLEEPIAAYVISQFCTDYFLHNSATRYVKAAVLNKESRENFVNLYTSFGLHHFATVMRKEPKRHEEMCLDGMHKLLGDAAIKMNVAIKSLQARN
jgi:hypothetical protein